MIDINALKTRLNQIAAARTFDPEKDLDKNAKQAIIQNAERLLNNIFLFNKPWDMERCKTPYQINPLDYEAIRNDDPSGVSCSIAWIGSVI